MLSTFFDVFTASNTVLPEWFKSTSGPPVGPNFVFRLFKTVHTAQIFCAENITQLLQIIFVFLRKSLNNNKKCLKKWENAKTKLDGFTIKNKQTKKFSVIIRMNYVRAFNMEKN